MANLLQTTRNKRKARKAPLQQWIASHKWNSATDCQRLLVWGGSAFGGQRGWYPQCCCKYSPYHGGSALLVTLRGACDHQLSGLLPLFAWKLSQHDSGPLGPGLPAFRPLTTHQWPTVLDAHHDAKYCLPRCKHSSIYARNPMQLSSLGP